MTVVERALSGGEDGPASLSGTLNIGINVEIDGNAECCNNIQYNAGSLLNPHTAWSDRRQSTVVIRALLVLGRWTLGSWN